MDDPQKMFRITRYKPERIGVYVIDEELGIQDQIHVYGYIQPQIEKLRKGCYLQIQCVEVTIDKGEGELEDS